MNQKRKERRIKVWDSIVKIICCGLSIAQLVECLSSMHKALSWIPTTIHKAWEHIPGIQHLDGRSRKITSLNVIASSI